MQSGPFFSNPIYRHISRWQIACDRLGDDNTSFIYEIDVDSGNATRLTDANAGRESSPAFSPDGKRISYSYSPGKGQPSSVVIENVFGIPGLGKEFVHSILDRDYNIVIGVFTSYAILVGLVNLIVELIYPILDPKIRY